MYRNSCKLKRARQSWFQGALRVFGGRVGHQGEGFFRFAVSGVAAGRVAPGPVDVFGALRIRIGLTEHPPGKGFGLTDGGGIVS